MFFLANQAKKLAVSTKVFLMRLRNVKFISDVLDTLLVLGVLPPDRPNLCLKTLSLRNKSLARHHGLVMLMNN